MFEVQLRKYRKERSLTQGKLAILLNNILGENFKAINVTSWEKGTNPKTEVISAIAEILDIPEQYLFNDSKEAIKKIVSSEIPDIRDLQNNTKKINLVDGYVGAGSASCIDCEDISSFLYVDNSIIKKGYTDKEIKALAVIGDSMSPYVEPDDIVLFSELEKGKYNCNDGKYIITTINGTMVKNLGFRANGDIVISSCNKCYSDEVIKSNESQEVLDIVGIVVGRILKS